MVTWSKVASKAGELLPYAFEKSDVQDKYGGENVFQAMMGGRSLRATGEAVYSSSCMDQGQDSAEHQLMEETVGSFSKASLRKFPLFTDVGGVTVWTTLLAEITEEIVGR